MHSFEIVIPGRLRSDQDRYRSVSTGAFLTNPALQRRLQIIHESCRRHKVCGTGTVKRLGSVTYGAICGADYQLRLNVQFIIGVRHAGQQPDADNLWKPLQNALAIPSLLLKVPGVSAGAMLYTLAVSDAQFCRFSVRVTPYEMVDASHDITVIQVEALPPPHLELSRAKGR
jgi:hypothetical protein